MKKLFSDLYIERGYDISEVRTYSYVYVLIFFLDDIFFVIVFMALWFRNIIYPSM